MSATPIFDSLVAERPGIREASTIFPRIDFAKLWSDISVPKEWSNAHRAEFIGSWTEPRYKAKVLGEWHDPANLGSAA